MPTRNLGFVHVRGSGTKGQAPKTNMATLIRPGLKFTAEPLPKPCVGLGPTMSSYGIPNLEGAPQRNEVYIVCRDGSIQSVYEPSRPIGWELLESPEGFTYRVTQMNHKPEPCLVFARGYEPDPPAGTGKIGSVVFAARPVARPACAEVTQQRDTGEEVTSALTRLRRATSDPIMLMAAEVVGSRDPAQVSALADFHEGKLSYAQMRSLCG